MIGDLALVNLANHPHPQHALTRACRIVASNRINMPFISATCCGDRAQAAFCIGIGEHALVKVFLDQDPGLSGYVEIVPSVGLLSVFPHQSSLRILGLSLHALGGAGLAVHALTSSLAPLTFVMDNEALDYAAAALEGVFELPSNQRPFRAKVQVTQSQVRRENEPAKNR